MLNKIIFLSLCPLFLMACTDDDVVVEEPVAASVGKQPGHEFKVDPASGKIEFKAEIVYFKYDDSTLTKQGMERLDALAEHMKKHESVKLTVAGHCDERGSIEYNLALGEQRAASVISYLVNVQVPAARVAATSYGEEKPADFGKGEAAWSKNRRAEFQLTSL